MKKERSMKENEEKRRLSFFTLNFGLVNALILCNLVFIV